MQIWARHAARLLIHPASGDRPGEPSPGKLVGAPPTLSLALAIPALAAATGMASLAAALLPKAVLLPGASLAVLAGAGLGVLFGLAQAAVARLAASPARASWIVCGALLGLFAAYRLRAFSKLDGDHRTLAIWTIGVMLAWGIAAGVLCAMHQPARDKPAFAIHLTRAGQCLTLALLGFIGLAAAAYETSARWLNTYPVVQKALIGFSWLCAGLALSFPIRAAVAQKPRFVIGLFWGGLLGAAFQLATLESGKLSRLARSPQSEYSLGLFRAASDWDRDGYSGILEGGDCAPWDARIHPAARETPGNGVDDNCNAGDASPPPLPVDPRPPTGLPVPAVDLLLITVDSLRADRTTPYGYARNTTPVLAEFAKSALRFENAYTPGGWTCLALPSLVGGVYPRRLSWAPMAITSNHHILPFPWEPRLQPGDRFHVTMTFPQEEKVWTIQHALKQRGYRTQLTITPRVRHLLVKFMKEGWDDVAIAPPGDDRYVTATALAQHARTGNAPYFSWVHYFSPHEEASDREDIARSGKSMSEQYDQDVAAADAEIGRLLESLQNSAPRPLAVIISSDHGEGLADTFQFHGVDVLEDSTRIPLLLRAPGVQPGVSQTPASLVDIAPTLLGISGTPVPQGLDGIDLRHAQGDRTVISDLWRLDEKGTPFIDQIAMTNRSYRLVYDRLRQSAMLLRPRDLSRPPREIENQRPPEALLKLVGRYQDSGGGP